MLQVFIGFDPKEVVALHVLANSIRRHASEPVAIVPIVLAQTPLTRPRDANQSTEFSYSRFLVPWLCGFEGRAAFLDCDQLVRCDIAELFSAADPRAAVSVVKHDYVPRSARKFLDQPQTVYRRKNWSSVMVFDNALCRALTPEFVDRASGMQLHQFEWLDDSEIGELPGEFNHLVGEYPERHDAKIAHFTLGTPCFARYRNCEFAKEWRDELRHATYYEGFKEYSRPARVDP